MFAAAIFFLTRCYSLDLRVLESARINASMREFNQALKTSTATFGEVATAISRVRRTVEQYRTGERRVTADAAREMVAYLRLRSEEFTAAADRLEGALQQEEQ